jgi:sialate O-acetylesterase
LLGGVWICSGQSNIQLTVGMIYNGTEEIAYAGNHRKIRVFTASQMMSPSPIEELLRIELNWSLASFSSVGGPDWGSMSAVCVGFMIV